MNAITADSKVDLRQSGFEKVTNGSLFQTVSRSHYFSKIFEDILGFLYSV